MEKLRLERQLLTLTLYVHMNIIVTVKFLEKEMTAMAGSFFFGFDRDLRPTVNAIEQIGACEARGTADL